jgi:hypothetical protein
MGVVYLGLLCLAAINKADQGRGGGLLHRRISAIGLHLLSDWRRDVQNCERPAGSALGERRTRGSSAEVGVAVFGLVYLDFFDDVDVDDPVNVAQSDRQQVVEAT